MVFKFVGGNIPSPSSYQLWTSSKTVSENVIAALDTTSTHRGHYKNRIVQNWQSFNPREVSRCEGLKQRLYLKGNALISRVTWSDHSNTIEVLVCVEFGIRSLQITTVNHFYSIPIKSEAIFITRRIVKETKQWIQDAVRDGVWAGSHLG